MKKRRNTVYVQAGRDVTLYVPVDTPPEVIDYLNVLKQEGTFSQSVMEMLTMHIQTIRQQAGPRPLPSEHADPGTDAIDSDWPGVPEPLNVPTTVLVRQADDLPIVSSRTSQTAHKLDLNQIFQQAQRNAGKLRDSDGH